MKRLKTKKGMTLVEMLVTLLILVFLIVGIGTCMSSAIRIYDEATFEADSATLAGIVNNTLSDILRFSTVRNDGTYIDYEGTKRNDLTYVFTSTDYSIAEAYFIISENEDRTNGVIQLGSLRNSNVRELINTGAYPNLMIDKATFHIDYVSDGEHAESGTELRGGYFKISYDIYSTLKPDTFNKHIDHIVRVMNK